MVLQTQEALEFESCRFLIQGQAKILADRLYGPDGPPVGATFAELERKAMAASAELRRLFLELVLARQADAMHRNLPEDLRRCSGCGRDTVAKDPKPRVFCCRGARVEWQEPHRHCPRCRKAFFPQSKALGIDTGRYSDSLLDLISYAGANKTSFREASRDLEKIGGHKVHEKQVERLTKQIGLERLAERQAEIDRFVNLPLAKRCGEAPEGVAAPAENQVAVVMADAGMLQIRKATVKTEEDDNAKFDEVEDANLETDDDDDDRDKPPAGRHWREDKVGLVMTMQSKVSESDPCPEVPETFIDPQRVAKIVRGLKKSAALLAEEENVTEAASESPPEDAPQDPLEKIKYEGPKLEKRRVVASRQNWPLFGTMLACAAWMSGFAKAKRKAFVADGARSIWRVWRSRFSSYVPILDFIHAMSYVYAAARAIGDSEVTGWQLYAEWIRLVWRGNVAVVIERLEEWQLKHGKPEKKETSARSVVAKSLRYLKNNQSKMKYDEYRKQGLPIVSSLVESMVKQISRRVKGTEKFWGDEGAEAILQLRADYLCDDEVMEKFWQRRQATATGQKSYKSKS